MTGAQYFKFRNRLVELAEEVSEMDLKGFMQHVARSAAWGPASAQPRIDRLGRLAHALFDFRLRAQAFLKADKEPG